jgi:hypothetical protein
MGIHTQAIARLLELRKRSAARDDQQSYTLWRSAYQRIHARQLFCNVETLGSATLYGFEVGGLESRTIKFVSDACEALSQLRRERAKHAPQADREEIERLCSTLRTMMHRAHEWHTDGFATPQAKQVPLIASSDTDLSQIFPRHIIVTYDNTAVARDRLLFHMCNIKILEALIEVHIEDFAFRQTNGINTDQAREFLLGAQPDMNALQFACRSVLDLVPYHIGYIDPLGNVNVSASSLNDTGVLTVKRPLKFIDQVEYVSPEIKIETRNVLHFLDAHRHVLRQP